MLNFLNTDPSWHPLLKKALSVMDKSYLNHLSQHDDWLPGKDKIFNAFSLPFSQTQRILFGESPYPRKASANGYAFWDNAVKDIFLYYRSPLDFKLSKTVNRATSLRNFIKMLLRVSESDLGQPSHADVVTTGSELFQNFLKQGFLLLNASLVFHQKEKVQEDAKHWRDFLFHLLDKIYQKKPDIEIILCGKIAKLIDPYLITHQLNFKKIICEHPYNLSFITNPIVLNYFKQFNLLQK